MSIRGYKVFNSDWTCRGFQYEVGKTYTHEGEIEVCSAGFHFCKKASDCFNYYKFDCHNKIAEVEAIGIVKTKDDKSVTDRIVIVREIEWKELLDFVNTGNYNTGYCNTGSCNTGNCNTGNCNTGNCNTGNCNTGDCNTGNCNTGDWNTCDFSNGFFNTKTPELIVFNKPLNMSKQLFLSFKGVQILSRNFKNPWWIYPKDMTAEEKITHPEHTTTGGYLKTIGFKTACKIMWDNFSDEEKQAVKEIPNFDAEVFKEITGIDVNNCD